MNTSPADERSYNLAALIFVMTGRPIGRDTMAGERAERYAHAIKASGRNAERVWNARVSGYASASDTERQRIYKRLARLVLDDDRAELQTTVDR